ncbi:uncharacterized protein LOC130636699 [Hydractinia symbiolongicarpus]|uniref:uncharacterized protein LOC130636699 n=1 Tax=Hydractinia symbiolongicarpus TaxID=13093 RepID=UPI00254B3A1E|nr:uncharacterized protein LOC130636699 [Hydractinia symbiolongicarpus]XP_057302497.1 uncharacterized protein LOC130636699 [Hydractinia symbiolongicarpus]XP_057302498.1 uncharacterized protein LOC130636699 [Hydractinia symbiolongicarpus]
MEIKVVSDEIIKLSSKSATKESIWLSVLDVCQPKVYVNFCYFFKNDGTDGSFSVKKMIDGLKVTLQEYPEVCGSIEYTTSGGVLNFDNHGVKLINSKANFSFKDVEAVGFEIEKLPEKDIFLPELQGFLLAKDAFLFIAQIISLTDDSLMLVVSFHHVLSDAHGIFRFMNAWASATKHGHVGTYSNNTDRSLLVGNGEKPTSLLDRGYISLTGPPPQMPSLGKMSKYEFFISFAKLDSLKERFSEDLPGNMYLSKNDILTAIIWKATVAARVQKKCETTMIATVVNSRKRFGLPEGYFGNCVPYLCKRLPVKDVLNMSLKETCLLLRKNYDVMSKNYVQDLMNWLQNQESLMSIMPSVNIFTNDLLFSSLAQHPMYECDFGLGKAHLIQPGGGPMLPGLIWIFPTPENDGLRFQYCLTAEEMAEFLANDYVMDTIDIVRKI